MESAHPDQCPRAGRPQETARLETRLPPSLSDLSSMEFARPRTGRPREAARLETRLPPSLSDLSSMEFARPRTGRPQEAVVWRRQPSFSSFLGGRGRKVVWWL